MPEVSDVASHEDYWTLVAARLLVQEMMATGSVETAQTPRPGDTQPTLTEMERLLRSALMLMREAERRSAVPSVRCGSSEIAERLAELLEAASSAPALDAERPKPGWPDGAPPVPSRRRQAGGTLTGPGPRSARCQRG